MKVKRRSLIFAIYHWHSGCSYISMARDAQCIVLDLTKTADNLADLVWDRTPSLCVCLCVHLCCSVHVCAPSALHFVLCLFCFLLWDVTKQCYIPAVWNCRERTHVPALLISLSSHILYRYAYVDVESAFYGRLPLFAFFVWCSSCALTGSSSVMSGSISLVHKGP